MNCTDEIARLVDDFSMGPIDPGDAEQRARWEAEEMDAEAPIATSASVASFWEKVSSWPGIIVVWMSSRSGYELCGLHSLLWHLPRANIHIVDVSNVEFHPVAAPEYDEREAFAIVRHDRIVQHGLLDAATPITDIARAASHKEWQRLREENAPLRVLTNAGLVSASIDYFDSRIRERITDSWQSGGRIVGRTYETLSTGSGLEFHSLQFIYVRLLHLLETDEFEFTVSGNNPWSMQARQIRRRPMMS